MLFSLKKKLMESSIAKRNQEHPFDYARAEGFTLEGVKDPLINNSYYFSAHNETTSLFVRLGRRIHQDETWLALFWEGKIYSLKQETFPAGQSPIQVKKEKGQWTVAFDGLLNEKDSFCLHASFQERQKPIDFSTDMPAARMATGMANEKWSKAFFANLQTISGQCHYEQEGLLEGSFTLHGEIHDFSLPCVRDHSFGKRDWNYMNNHVWLMAVSSPVQFNYSMVSYPALSVLETGNYRDSEGMHYLLQANLDLRQAIQGTIPQELSFEVKLDNGQLLPVKAKVLTGVTYQFQGGQYILHENIAEFRIGTNECRGILEIGFNADEKRYFNQRDLTKIKR